MWFPMYPYLNIQDLNLDYILKTIKEQNIKLDNFINFNSIKYADPMEWNITTQYEANTVVIDNVNHIAYLSMQAVPSGVSLTNTDYWTPILDLTAFYAEIGDLSTLDTTAKDTLVNAINEVFSEIEKALKSSWATPEEFGAVGDGLTDDTAAVQAALNDGRNVLLNGTYLIVASDVAPYHNTLTVNSNTIIDGHGKLKLQGTAYTNYSILYLHNVDNVIIRNIEIVGDVQEHIGSTGEWGFGINVDDSSNVTIDNVECSYCWGDGFFIAHLNDAEPVTRNKNVHVLNCHCHHCRRNNITVSAVEGCYIIGCEVDHANGTAPEAGIDIEPDQGIAGEIVDNIIISDCYFHDNTMRALEIDNFNTEQVNNVVVSNCIFNNENIGIRAIAGTNTETRPIIEGNQFINVDRPIFADSCGCIIEGNYFKGTSTAARVFHLGGTKGKFSNNYISIITSANHIIYCSGSWEISDNKFENVGSTVDIIDLDSANCHILRNHFDNVNSVPNMITFESNVNTIIAFNDMTPTGKPGNFIVTVLSPNTEMIAFNIAHYSNGFIYGGTLTALANIRNGVYNA